MVYYFGHKPFFPAQELG